MIKSYNINVVMSYHFMLYSGINSFVFITYYSHYQKICDEACFLICICNFMEKEMYLLY
jgi:hypothetical protein